MKIFLIILFLFAIIFLIAIFIAIAYSAGLVLNRFLQINPQFMRRKRQNS